jgi:UDPglucose 6-dehydrogenase
MSEARKLMPGLETADDPFSCIAGADVMVILTEWDQFRALDLDRVKALLRTPLVVDLRNVYKPTPMAEKGFAYVSIGRNDIPLPSNPGVP